MIRTLQIANNQGVCGLILALALVHIVKMSLGKEQNPLPSVSAVWSQWCVHERVFVRVNEGM